MASGLLDTLLLRHAPRWIPMAQHVVGLDPHTWHDNFYQGHIPSPMGIWGHKSHLKTKLPKTRVSSEHSPNSCPRMPQCSTPREPSKTRSPESKNSQTVFDKVKTEALQFRPTIRRQTQIPGRFFPKPSLTDEERVIMAVQTGRPLSGSYLMSNKHNDTKKLAKNISYSAVSNEKPVRPMSSYNAKIVNIRKTVFDHNENVAKSEVFMISFRDEDRRAYDPSSELHSDYYTVKRQVRFCPVRQVSVPTKEGRFADMIRGKAKCMHSRG